MTMLPVFSKSHGVKILEIINEVFADIDESKLHVCDSSDIFIQDSIFGLEELLSSAYDDFETDFVDPDALPE